MSARKFDSVNARRNSQAPLETAEQIKLDLPRHVETPTPDVKPFEARRIVNLKVQTAQRASELAGEIKTAQLSYLSSPMLDRDSIYDASVTLPCDPPKASTVLKFIDAYKSMSPRKYNRKSTD